MEDPFAASPGEDGGVCSNSVRTKVARREKTTKVSGRVRARTRREGRSISLGREVVDDLESVERGASRDGAEDEE